MNAYNPLMTQQALDLLQKSRRIAELDSGNAKTIPWDEVRRRISKRAYQLGAP
jgi:hypothetical protein